MEKDFFTQPAGAVALQARMRPQAMVVSLLMMATTLGGLWLLFLHLMQRNAPFAEAVAKISPDLANTYSCSCPFCSGKACLPPADQQGLERFHGKFPI